MSTNSLRRKLDKASLVLYVLCIVVHCSCSKHYVRTYVCASVHVMQIHRLSVSDELAVCKA